MLYIIHWNEEWWMHCVLRTDGINRCTLRHVCNVHCTYTWYYVYTVQDNGWQCSPTYLSNTPQKVVQRTALYTRQCTLCKTYNMVHKDIQQYKVLLKAWSRTHNTCKIAKLLQKVFFWFCVFFYQLKIKQIIYIKR